MDDRHLVRRMLDGDERAFDEFFATHFDRLFRFALRRLGSREAAEDAAQTAMVQAIRKLQTWRGEAALFTWLCAICRREILAHWREPASLEAHARWLDEPLVAAMLDRLAADGDSPEQAMHKQEVAALVQLTLDHLPGRYGDVLEWKYLRDWPVVEIAERLGLTPKAAESMLTRARETFRRGFLALASSPGGR